MPLLVFQEIHEGLVMLPNKTWLLFGGGVYPGYAKHQTGVQDMMSYLMINLVITKIKSWFHFSMTSARYVRQGK